MFADAIAKVRLSLFPIFWYQILSNGGITIGISGTGFFVREDGLFITSCHVIDNIPEDAKIYSIGNIPHIPGSEETIIEITRDESADVFVGKLIKNKLPPLEISDEIPPMGRSICIAGYPMPEIKGTPNGIDYSNVRQYFQPSFVLDYFKFSMPYNGKRVKTQRVYDSFLIRDTSLPGLSGGPAFGIDGKVYGVNNSTFTREIPPTASRPKISVSAGVIVQAKYILELIRKIS